MLTCSFFPLLCILFISGAALFGYGLLRCQFTSPDDVVYLAQIFYNKVLLGGYNSTEGKYTGYTKKAKEFVDVLNKNPTFLKEEKINLEKCKTHTAFAFEVLSKPVEPSVRLSSVKVAGSKHPNILVCSAYSFYPKQINVTWLRNGKEATSDVTSTEELPDGNWFYQIHSYLELTPTFGEKISCKVEHASFQTPRIYEWGSIPESERNKIAVGASGLLLGLVFMCAGIISYLKNRTGRILVPQSQPAM
uniref:rano class II histocompatibility antigen, A beta chain-like isoform X2 n=1 Tax=Semicossyphus pulcher TaxID=241346 RepID=UPI0037E7A432